uniref:C2H2-type domain-containing protein n=1 Tax=Elaeophora elaphi TaxID=1147741 RepID=A0A0R3RQY2_9BILA
MLPPILRAPDHCNALVRRLHQCRQKGELLDCSIRVDTVNGYTKHILAHQIIIHCSSNILNKTPCDVMKKVKNYLLEFELHHSSKFKFTCTDNHLISNGEGMDTSSHAKYAVGMKFIVYGSMLFPDSGIVFHASTEDSRNPSRRQYALDSSSWLQSFIDEAAVTSTVKEVELWRKPTRSTPSDDAGEYKNGVIVPSNEREGWCRNKKYIERVPSGYMCTVCQKVYGRYNSVSYHVTIYHRNPPIRCDEEGCKFSTREARYIHFHKFYRHRVPLPENIDLGKHISKSPAMLEKHINRHLQYCTKTGQEYQCPQCEKQASSQQEMLEHMVMHAEQEEPSFQCEHCKYRSVFFLPRIRRATAAL